MLGRTVQFDPKVAERRDLVSIYSPRPDGRADRKHAAVAAQGLWPDGHGLWWHGAGRAGRLAIGRSARTAPRALQHSRRCRFTAAVFQLVDLEAVRNTEVASWLKTILGNRVTVTEDPTRNALMLSGTSDNVAAAIDTIRLLDQPVMRGRSSCAYAGLLVGTRAGVHAATGAGGRRLFDATAQPTDSVGWCALPHHAVARSGDQLLTGVLGQRRGAATRQDLGRQARPAQQADLGKNFFTYTPRNVSADSLARTLGQLLQGAAAGAVATAAAPSAAGQALQAPRRGLRRHRTWLVAGWWSMPIRTH